MQPTEEFRYLALAVQREGARLIGRALEPLGITTAQGEVIRVLQNHRPHIELTSPPQACKPPHTSPISNNAPTNTSKNTTSTKSTTAITHLRIKNDRLAAAGWIRAFTAMANEGPARNHCRNRRAHGDRHAPALRSWAASPARRFPGWCGSASARPARTGRAGSSRRREPGNASFANFSSPTRIRAKVLSANGSARVPIFSPGSRLQSIAAKAGGGERFDLGGPARLEGRR